MPFGLCHLTAAISYHQDHHYHSPYLRKKTKNSQELVPWPLNHVDSKQFLSPSGVEEAQFFVNILGVGLALGQTGPKKIGKISCKILLWPSRILKWRCASPVSSWEQSKVINYFNLHYETPHLCSVAVNHCKTHTLTLCHMEMPLFAIIPAKGNFKKKQQLQNNKLANQRYI